MMGTYTLSHLHELDILGYFVIFYSDYLLIWCLFWCGVL